MNLERATLFDSGDRRWVVLWGLIAFVLAAWAAKVPLGGVPHVNDEVAYTLQSRLFAEGMRVGPSTDNSSMLMYPFWSADQGAYSPFPPGWPALLSVGERIGVPWLVNPMIVGLLPLLVWILAVSWSDRKTARMAVVLTALSPAIWLMAGSRMSHTSVLVAIGMVAAVVVRRPERSWLWLIAGVAAGYVVLARPFDAVCAVAPLFVVGLLGCRSWLHRLTLLLPSALAVALVFWDNASLTGDMLEFPMNHWFEQWAPERPGCNRLGFGDEVGCARTLGSFGHTPGKALKLALERLKVLDGLFVGVHGGFLLAAWGAVKLRPRWPWFIVALLLVGYGLYWSPGQAYGARFYHPLLLVLPIAVAVPLTHLPRWGGLVLAVSVTLAGGSRIAQEVADRYWCVDDSLVRLLEHHEINDGVVFLHGVGTRAAQWPALGIEGFRCDPLLESGDGMHLNNPAFPSSGLRIRHALPDLEQTRRYLAEHHPGARAWLVVHEVSADQRRVAEIAPGGLQN